MSSIALAVFKHTIGLLVNKGRDKAAEKLKDGDVTDQNFRALIVREIDDIKSKLDGLSRKDLLASISFFKEGIELLYEVFDKASSRSSFGAVTASAARAEKVCLAEEVKNLELNDLDESETRKLSKAKKLFEDARRKATEAFNNEALGTSDRILAMQYRVMATILETVDNPADALAQGRVCINELHSMAAVKNSFNTQLKKGIQTFRGLFSKEERRQIISDVCHVNRVIYDITLTLGEGLSVSVHPVVDTGKEKVELLSDERVGKVLRKQGMEHCIVAPSSFGLAAEKGHKLFFPSGIVTNSRGEFFVADIGRLMVFDRGGKFVKRFSFRSFGCTSSSSFHCVAIDSSDNVFVLTEWKGKYRFDKCPSVFKLTKTSDLSRQFSLRKKDGYRGLSVSDTGRILTLREAGAVEEYDTGGKFVRSFGERILKEAFDITIANDGRVMVAGVDGINTFSDHGVHLDHFQLQTPYRISSVGLTYHRAGEHVVVASMMRELLDVAIYTNNGEFVRSAQIQHEHFYSLGGIALTTDERIAIALKVEDYSSTPINVSKVLVLRKPYLTP